MEGRGEGEEKKSDEDVMEALFSGGKHAGGGGGGAGSVTSSRREVEDDNRSVLSMNSNRGTVVDGMSKVAERRRSRQGGLGPSGFEQTGAGGQARGSSVSSMSSLQIARARARSKRKQKKEAVERGSLLSA